MFQKAQMRKRRRHLGGLGFKAVTCAVFLLLLEGLSASDLQQVQPTDGDRDVHPGRNLRVETSGPVESANNVSVSLSIRDGAEIPFTMRFDELDDTVIVDPIHALDAATVYDFCVASFERGSWAAALHILSGGRICSSFETRAQSLIQQNLRDAPLLIVTGPDNPYSAFYAEIMKAEGLTLFNAVPSVSVDEDTLGDYAVVLLGTSDFPNMHLPALRHWVQAGGTLVAMKPRGELSRIFCLGETRTSKAGGYLQVEPPQATAGITDRPMQIHGETVLYDDLPGCLADLPLPDGEEERTETVARLYDRKLTALPHPAVVTRRIGKGEAIVFSFDLARSVAFTRQGNPVWANQEHDGSPPRRPSDMFQHGYLDTDLLDVPQADEQQRLLANLVITSAAMPLPRFWYLPERRRAAIIMVGDDHATAGGTEHLFYRLNSLSEPNCDLGRWECLRATALLAPDTVFAPETAETYHEAGFEIGLHVDTGCVDHELPTLREIYARQTSEFRAKYPSLPPQVSQRLHCIVWNGWTDTAELESSFGVRFDTNYYNWPPLWLKTRPGFMTGSGLPMPFITQNGVLLDVYQAPTQLVNENGVPHREGIAAMLDGALGKTQYFSAFVAHYDFADDYDKILIEEARKRNVALISAQQMLDWLDGRNSSTFADIRWNDGKLDFRMELARGAEHASVLLPLSSDAGTLSNIRCEGRDIPFAPETIKGIDYASFAAMTGSCSSTYSAPQTATNLGRELLISR